MTNDPIDLLRSFDPEKLTEDVVKLGEEWAEADAAASLLEETKKTFYASLMSEYLDAPTASGKSMPVSQAEVRALGDPRYSSHLELMTQARRYANQLRVKYDMGRMKLELYRSWQATLRHEMNMKR